LCDGQVIAAAAFCPHPPVLVPALAGAAARDLDGLRAAALSAIQTVAAHARHQLIALGTHVHSVRYGPAVRGSLREYGVAVQYPLGTPGNGAAAELPLSLTIAGYLLAEALGPGSGAVGFGIGPDFAASRPGRELLALTQRETVSLLVMGDGSARRTERAPGYLHPSAVAFDERVAAALGDGQAAALAAISDPDDVLAGGVPAWRVAGTVLEGQRYDATLQYADAPYGVAYFVASWLRHG
jgi:hypothetical protein